MGTRNRSRDYLKYLIVHQIRFPYSLNYLFKLFNCPARTSRVATLSYAAWALALPGALLVRTQDSPSMIESGRMTIP